jgi:hypothetical protein
MERKMKMITSQKRSTRFFLLMIIVLVVISMACGMLNQVLEQIVSDDEAAVEAPVTIEEPADVETPSDTALPANFPLYPGAEMFTITDRSGQDRVLRYLTDDSIDDVQAFYQSHYPYLLFEDGIDSCLVWDVAEQDAEQFLQELVGIGVFNMWICRTDEAFLLLASHMGDAYMPEEDLEALPENMTLIEIWVGN